MNLTLINLSLAAYFLACIFYLINQSFKSKIAGRIATVLLMTGFAANTIVISYRWYIAKHLPFANMYESLVFFSWSIVLVYLIFEFIYKFKIIGVLASLFALLALGYASVLDSTVQPLLPALRSNWIAIHVASYFLGYAAITVAFAASLIYLFASRKSNSNSSLANKLDALNYRLIAFAFPLLTIGLTTGAVWANVAWGRYWSWDPKETWSLITWLIYALHLHLRMVRGWKGKRLAYVSIAGFLVVLFTFLGVNIFFSGLHSYA